jgi:hypothetical protein
VEVARLSQSCTKTAFVGMATVSSAADYGIISRM